MSISEGGVEGVACGETKRQENTSEEPRRLIVENTALAGSHCAHTWNMAVQLGGKLKLSRFIEILKIDGTFMYSQYLHRNNNYFKGVYIWQITFISNLILDSAAILKSKMWDSQSWSLASIMKLEGVLLQMWTWAWPELCVVTPSSTLAVRRFDWVLTPPSNLAVRWYLIGSRGRNWHFLTGLRSDMMFWMDESSTPLWMEEIFG